MDNIRFFEEASANGHPPLDVLLYDGWLLRFSEGVTGRANSVSVLYPSTVGLPEKIAYCEERYAARGLPCLFKVTDVDGELEQLLLDRGYSAVTPTDVMLRGLGDFPFPETADLVFTDAAEWFPRYFAFEETADPHRRDVLRRIHSKVAVDTLYGTLFHEGKPAACASGAVERGYMLLQNVVVDPSLRGRGLGRKLCEGMLARAREAGARHAYLQVVRKNAAALKLYENLGFRKIYAYRYLKKVPAGSH